MPTTRLLACLFAVTTLTACGTYTTSTPSKPDQTKSAAQSLKPLLAEFNKAVDRPTVPLTWHLGLTPVAGFTQDDVDALAKRAVDVLRRSVQPKLSAMNPDEAVDYVYAHQFAATTYNFKTSAAAVVGGYDWQWLAASRYVKVPTSQPKVIKIAAAVERDRGKLDDGTPAPILRVTVQAHVLQEVASDHGTVPIVIRRSVQASGFRPRGGPGYWPSIITRTAGSYGNTYCALFTRAQLVPLEDPDVLRQDLADLKISLASKTVIDENFNSSGNPKALSKYIAKKCSHSGP